MRSRRRCWSSRRTRTWTRSRRSSTGGSTATSTCSSRAWATSSRSLPSATKTSSSSRRRRSRRSAAPSRWCARQTRCCRSRTRSSSCCSSRTRSRLSSSARQNAPRSATRRTATRRAPPSLRTACWARRSLSLLLLVLLLCRSRNRSKGAGWSYCVVSWLHTCRGTRDRLECVSYLHCTDKKHIDSDTETARETGRIYADAAATAGAVAIASVEDEEDEVSAAFAAASVFAFLRFFKSGCNGVSDTLDQLLRLFQKLGVLEPSLLPNLGLGLALRIRVLRVDAELLLEGGELRLAGVGGGLPAVGLGLHVRGKLLGLLERAEAAPGEVAARVRVARLAAAHPPARRAQLRAEAALAAAHGRRQTQRHKAAIRAERRETGARAELHGRVREPELGERQLRLALGEQSGHGADGRLRGDAERVGREGREGRDEHVRRHPGPWTRWQGKRRRHFQSPRNRRLVPTPSAMPPAQKVLVIDNGASTLKAGVSSDADGVPVIIPNYALRSKGDKTLYIGHEIEDCQDFASATYRLAFERGLLTDWDVEKAVWDGVFSADVLGIHPPDMSLLVTEPYFNLPNIQETYDQLVFEEYEFQSYFRCTPAAAATHSNLFAEDDQPAAECVLVVDAGYSFTHVVPLLNGKVLWPSVRRIDVGGKLLTNHLKELVSYRQWNMMDQTHVMNDVKERCCYVAASHSQFLADLETCKTRPRSNGIVREYVLPDFSGAHRKTGFVRGQDQDTDAEPMDVDEEQVLYMGNERFCVPEVLFNPSDIGLEQAGVAETVAHVIASLPADLQGMFWAHIGLVGGTTALPGFGDRLLTELRALAPAEYQVSIYESEDPITQAYSGAHAFARSPAYARRAVTRAEYEEGGSNAVRRRMRGPPDRAHGAASADISFAPPPPVQEKEREKARTKQAKPKLNTPVKATPPPPPPAPTHGRATRAARAAAPRIGELADS